MYTDEKGRTSAYPFGREAANRERTLLYNCGYVCGHCGISPYRYTRTDECHACARLDALDLFNIIRNFAQTTYRYGLIHKVTLPGRSSRYLSPRQSDRIRHAMALYHAAPDRYKVVPAMCAKAGHVGLQDTQGRCYYCLTAKGRGRSPRQRAIAAGQKTYKPTKPCKRCGTYRPRRVDNGKCGCMTPSPSLPALGTSAEVRETIKALQGQVITWRDAQHMGLKVYSPDGRHWRYTSCRVPVRGLPGQSSPVST